MRNRTIGDLERDFAYIVIKYDLPKLVGMDDVTIAKYLATCLSALKTANKENRYSETTDDQ